VLLVIFTHPFFLSMSGQPILGWSVLFIALLTAAQTSGHKYIRIGSLSILHQRRLAGRVSVLPPGMTYAKYAIERLKRILLHPQVAWLENEPGVLRWASSARSIDFTGVLYGGASRDRTHRGLLFSASYRYCIGQ
jgi:hypothetical protein